MHLGNINSGYARVYSLRRAQSHTYHMVLVQAKMASFNYTWQGGYYPPSLHPTQQFNSNLQQVNSQAANPSSSQQYVHPHTSQSSPTQPPNLLRIFIWRLSVQQIRSLDYTMHSLVEYVDSPDKLKKTSSWTVWWFSTPVDKMEIGYFHQSKKIWIKDR